MKTFIKHLLVSLFFTLVISQVLFAQRPTAFIEWEGQSIEVFTDHLEVYIEENRFKDTVATRISVASEKLKMVNKRRGIMAMPLEEGANIHAMVETVRQIPGVVKAGPSVVVRASVVPNDTDYSQQYGPQITQMPLSWDITTGDNGVLVGVIDSGIPLEEFTTTLSHQDLDNDQRIILGDDFSTGDEGVRDLFGHGTHVTGILSADTDNGDGIAGSSWNSRILVIKYFNNGGGGTWHDFLNAVEYAVDEGADIINFSGGGTADPNETAMEAVEYAENNGVLLVVAAGNYNAQTNPNRIVEFPAAYSDEFDNVIAVSATDDNDEATSFSSYGDEVNISAPGNNIYSTMPDYQVTMNGSPWNLSQDYDSDSGTSMSAPHVAGTAALMLSVDATLSPSDIRNLQESTADKVGQYSYSGGWNEYMGHGRLNAYEAVKEAMPNQYAGQSFTSSTTLPDLSRIKGSTSISSGVTLTISSGDLTIIEGSMNSSGSTIAVGGRLIIEESANLSNIHLDVNSGGELIIRKDASLSFDSGQGIEGNGVITIKGTNADRITLDASGGSNWNGVEVNEDNSSIKYVDIEDAVNGITSYNVSGLEVQNVEVFNSTWDGFRFINTSTSSPVGGFGYFRADGNGTYGVYYDGGSNDELRNNIMVDNPTSGLFITGGASLENVINSRIYNGGTNGVRADNSSYLELNSCSIHDNAYKEAFAYNNSTINATGNWWGTSSPSASQFEEVSGGSIDYSNHLFFDPLPTSFEKRVATADLNSQAIVYEDPVTSINSVASLREALSGFKKEEALTELQRISGSELSPDLNEWAKIIQVEIYQRLDNHQQAIEIGNTTLASQGVSPEIHTTMGRRLFYSYLLGTEDVQAAETMLSNLEQWGEDESELKQLTWLLERHKEDALSGDGNESPKKIAQKTDVQLSNYPNPFNPSTVIKYQLPQNTAVRLQVFDMLGREVVTLVDEQQSAGEYSATFDASMLSSGIYIYRLQAGSEVITKQMTLIK